LPIYHADLALFVTALAENLPHFYFVLLIGKLATGYFCRKEPLHQFFIFLFSPPFYLYGTDGHTDWRARCPIQYNTIQWKICTQKL